jgi:argininosuccinate synthase
MYKLTVDPELAPDTPLYLDLSFDKGNCVAIDGETDSPAEIIRKLNKIAGKHAIGRVDLVENRFVGMKSRGVYETPGGTVLLHAHRQLETLTMDRDLMHLRDSLIPRYGELIYNGFWYAPEREALQALIDQSQSTTSGTVRLKLYKGGITTVGRKSEYSLYDESIASMDDDESDYKPEDAGGFIRLNSLRLKERFRKQNYKG